jgi:hypothetical protein
MPKRIMLAFRGSMSMESALVDSFQEGSARSVADEDKRIKAQLSQAHDCFPRPSQKASSCRHVIHECECPPTSVVSALMRTLRAGLGCLEGRG